MYTIYTLCLILLYFLPSSSSSSSPPPLHTLHSVMDFGFQHELPSFPTVSGHCLTIFIPTTLKSSSTLSFHLLRGLHLSLLLPVRLPQFVLALFRFAVFQHDHTLLFGGFFFNFPISSFVTCSLSDFGSLEVACWPLVPKFAGSNPTEAFGFFRAKDSSARLPSEGK